MASNLLAMASNLLARVSNQIAYASPFDVLVSLEFEMQI